MRPISADLFDSCSVERLVSTLLALRFASNLTPYITRGSFRFVAGEGRRVFCVLQAPLLLEGISLLKQ